MSQALKKDFSLVLDYLQGRLKLAHNISEDKTIEFLQVFVELGELKKHGINFRTLIPVLGYLHRCKWHKLRSGGPYMVVLNRAGEIADLAMEEGVRYPLVLSAELIHEDVSVDSTFVEKLVQLPSKISPSRTVRVGSVVFNPTTSKISVINGSTYCPQYKKPSRRLLAELWKRKQVVASDGSVREYGETMSPKALYAKIGLDYSEEMAASEFKTFARNIRRKFPRGKSLIEISGSRRVQLVITR